MIFWNWNSKEKWVDYVDRVFWRLWSRNAFRDVSRCFESRFAPGTTDQLDGQVGRPWQTIADYCRPSLLVDCWGWCILFVYTAVVHTSRSSSTARSAVAEVSNIGNYRRGELLWYMDGRANPLMDFKVVGVSGYLYICRSSSIYLCICLSFHLPICPPISLATCLSIGLSIYVYIICVESTWRFIHLYIYLLSIYLSVYLSACLTVSLSVYLSVWLSLFLSIYPSMYLSIYLSACLSINQSNKQI
jgi:hypothetical protein